MSSEDDYNLITFIATTVEALRTRVDAIGGQMATKVDLASLKDQMASLENQMATKEDFFRVESRLGRVESRLGAVESRLNSIGGEMATRYGLSRLEKTMHGEFEQVHLRIDSIDRGMGGRIGQIETDISRLRSVLYFLVKDKPDMLRLLGQPTPGEGRP